MGINTLEPSTVPPLAYRNAQLGRGYTDYRQPSDTYNQFVKYYDTADPYKIRMMMMNSQASGDWLRAYHDAQPRQLALLQHRGPPNFCTSSGDCRTCEYCDIKTRTCHARTAQSNRRQARTIRRLNRM